MNAPPARSALDRFGELVLWLDPAHGLDPSARNLVLERIYPTRWVAPRLYGAGDEIRIPLLGYEAAVYELMPVEKLAGPLPVDAVFEAVPGGIRLLDVGDSPGVVGPGGFQRAGRDIAPSEWAEMTASPPPLAAESVVAHQESGLEVSVTLDASARQATLGVMLRPEREGLPDPGLKVEVDGQVVEAGRVSQAGKWPWLTVEVGPGEHRLRLTAEERWVGRAEVWLAGLQESEGVELEAAGDDRELRRLLPPSGRGDGVLPRVIRLGSAGLDVKRP